MSTLEGFLSEKAVLALVPVSRATIWKWRQAGAFPNPVPLSARRKGYPRRLIEEWIAARMDAAGVADVGAPPNKK